MMTSAAVGLLVMGIFCVTVGAVATLCRSFAGLPALFWGVWLIQRSTRVNSDRHLRSKVRGSVGFLARPRSHL